MSELQNFYQSILNIRNQDKRKQIEQIVLEEKEALSNQVSDVAGFCKLIANQIQVRFDSENIRSYWIDLNDIIGVDHVILIAEYQYHSIIHRFLIDPTYQQFVYQENHQLLKFKEWPGDRLEKGILNDLISKGITEIDDEKFLKYLSSFGNYEQAFSLDSFLLNYQLKGGNRRR